MTQRPTEPYSRVLLTEAAIADLHTIKARSLEVLRNVFRQLKRLDAGDIVPVRLHDFAKTGDLTDCGKIIVDTDGQPEYRIVVRHVGDTIEILEVVAVEARADDLAYLLAGLRLGRHGDPDRRSEAARRVARIRRLLDPN